MFQSISGVFVKYRNMHELSVSEIGLGCSGFWGSRQFDERKAVRIVHEAFNQGINHFDTGHNYCNYNAEPRLGRALAEILKTNNRSNLVISTKAGTLRRRPILPSSVKTQDHSPDYIEAACAQGIKNLNCGYIDVFYLHNFPAESISDELIKRLDMMRRRGMFRLLGINTHNERTMKYIADLRGVFDVALIDLNVAQLDRLPIVNYLYKSGVSVVAGTVLAQGHLVDGKIGQMRRISDLWYFARSVLKSDSKRLARAAKNIRPALNTVHGMSPAQAAIAYILGLNEISSCIFGTTDLKNLKEICAAPHKILSAEESDTILSTFRSSGKSISS